MTPYRNNGNLTANQSLFNTVLSSVRQKVERSISLLKGRWRRLLYLDYLDIKLAVEIVISACVLHNFCLVHDDFDDGYLLDDDDDGGGDSDGTQPPEDGTAQQKRVHLMNIISANQ